MRRKGYPAAAIHDFMGRVGVAKADSTVQGSLLDQCVREALADVAPRPMAVIDPLKVVLTNWPEDKVDVLTVENHRDHPEFGTREVKFGRELYIEREDFMEVPVKGFKRMAPGREVRLMAAYIVRCDEVVKDEAGNILALHCSVDMDSRSGSEGSNRKLKTGVLHWVSAVDSVPAEFRLYEPILEEEAQEDTTPGASAESELDEAGREVVAEDDDFMNHLNPNSLVIRRGFCESWTAAHEVGATFQFQRIGYFCKDPDSTEALPVFNRTVPLKDSWAKESKK